MGQQPNKNQRENYRDFCRQIPGARVPNMDHGALPETIERWWHEGLSPDLDPHRFDEWCDAFGLDRYYFCVGIGPARHLPAPFQEEVLEETEHTITKRHADGSIRQEGKPGTHQSIPHEIRPASLPADRRSGGVLLIGILIFQAGNAVF